jgi:4-amino-4-deoxy-L-arabinose transferase-like glycosyltransferase
VSASYLSTGLEAPPQSPGAEGANPRHRKWDGPRIAVVLAAIISAAVAALLSRTVFSHLSVNNDETVYLLQAKAFAHGHLFPPVGNPPTSFTPWLGVIRGDHYVLKYTPVVAAYMAISLVLTGGYLAGLVVLAMGLVGATFLLASEVTGHRGVAAGAAVILAASPVVMVQSALILPYLLFLVLAELALWALFAGARRHSFGVLALGGLCAGIAFVARSYDAVLLFTPAVAWLLWRTRGQRRQLIQLVGAIIAGALAPAVVLLWFDYAATGSALRLPFSMFQKGDTLGFGVHRIYPGERGRVFGIAQGWKGLARHLSLLGGGWMFGGVLLLLLSAVALIRRVASAACLALLAGGLLLVVGYLFFWGTWNAGILWGGTRYLGPYYLMPALIPLAILAALGLRELHNTGAWKAALVVVLSVTISAVTLGRALTADAGLNADNSQLASAIARQGKSVMFVKTYPNYLQHPTSVIANAMPIGGRTVFALMRGSDDFRVISNYPGRQLYRLRLLGEYGKRPHAGFGAQLQRLHVVSGVDLALGVTVTLPRSVTGGRLQISIDGRHRMWTLAPHRSNRIALRLTAGQGPLAALPAGGSTAHITLFGQPARGGAERMLDQQDLPLRQSNGQLQALAPTGAVTELGPAPAPALSLDVTRP